MKYSELEAQSVTESPMGFFSQLGNQIAGKLGSATAQGKLQAGQIANYIYKQFRQNLGASNQKPTPEILAGFLRSVGVPDASIQAAHGQVIGNQPQQPLNASTDPDAVLNRKQQGQYILRAVQHANQAGTLSFDQPASNDDTTTSDQPDSTTGDQPERTSDRMDTELRELHNRVLQGDLEAAQALVQSLSDINNLVKRHANAANKSIGRGIQDDAERKKLIPTVRTLTRESYQHLTRAFGHANITWRQVGYRPALRENAQGKIVLMPINNKNNSKRSS